MKLLFFDNMLKRVYYKNKQKLFLFLLLCAHSVKKLGGFKNIKTKSDRSQAIYF